MSACSVDSRLTILRVIQTAVDNCLWYEIEEVGLQYETAFGVDRYPDSSELPMDDVKQR